MVREGGEGEGKQPQQKARQEPAPLPSAFTQLSRRVPSLLSLHFSFCVQMDNAQLRVAALQRHLHTGGAGNPLLETSPTSAGGSVRVARIGALSCPVSFRREVTQSRNTCKSLQGLPEGPDDVVIVSALRTPMTKAKKGGLRDTPAETLLAALIKETLTRTRVDPAAVGDLVVGSVLGSNVWRANQVRLAAFLGGLPESVRCPTFLPRGNRALSPDLLTRALLKVSHRSRAQVPVRTVNRQCSSGLQACADIAAGIKVRFPGSRLRNPRLQSVFRQRISTPAAGRASSRGTVAALLVELAESVGGWSSPRRLATTMRALAPALRP